MKVGAIVLATEQGLGYLAKDFFDNGVIDYVLIQPHSSRTNHYEWYPAEARVKDIQELVFRCDSLLFFEELWNWKVIPLARNEGKPTVLMPMYECTRNPLPYQPSKIICPSLLDMQYYPHGEFIPVPVDVKWRLRKRARVFVHNAGNGGIGGRNGTKELVEAMQYVKSPLKLIIRSQVYIKPPDDPRIELQIGTVRKEHLWDTGDVFVFPEKFNGLSLPLQEAFASGMAVMAGNRFPINTWLPNPLLIPTCGYKKERIAVEFECAQYDPKTIAATMDEWYDKDISSFSKQGRVWAYQNSWKKLKGKYLTALSR